MKPSETEILYAQRILREAGYVISLFHKCDIIQVAEEQELSLTTDEVNEVAEQLENVDANHGVNWETIDYYINVVVSERKF